MTAIESRNLNALAISGSDRSFGFVFTVFFAIVGLMPLLGKGKVNWWAIGISISFFVVSLISPQLLKPLHRLWYRLGLLLNNVTSPIIMGVIFFGALTPLALLMRLLGKSPLSLKYSYNRKSYWVLREPPGPPAQSMKNQF